MESLMNIMLVMYEAVARAWYCRAVDGDVNNERVSSRNF